MSRGRITTTPDEVGMEDRPIYQHVGGTQHAELHLASILATVFDDHVPITARSAGRRTYTRFVISTSIDYKQSF